MTKKHKKAGIKSIILLISIAFLLSSFLAIAYVDSKEAISTTEGAIPFYTNGSNPVNSTNISCLGDMDNGSQCVVEWYVYATGDEDTYTFFSNASYGQDYNITTNSSELNITILSSNLSCSYQSGSCSADYVDLLHISSLTDGHAELPNQSEYTYSLCCKDSSGNYNLTNSSGFNFLDLSNYTDAHVEIPGTTDYSFDAYFGADGAEVTCTYNKTYGDCGNSVCLTTISTDIVGSNTDLHIGDCVTDPYETSVCCEIRGDNIPPAVSLVSPADESIISKNRFNLTCNATDNLGVSNMTLWTNTSGIWKENITVGVAGSEVEYSFEITGLADGNYTWSCSAYDTSGNQDFSEENRSFSIISPEVQCVVNEGGCINTYSDYTEILRLENYTNAHAELVNGTDEDYNWTVCCKDINDATEIINSSGTTIASLSYHTNAHAETSEQSNYDYDVLMGATNLSVLVEYNYTEGDCGEESFCVFTMSNYTNAHLADCITEPYNLTVCASLTEEPLPEEIVLDIWDETDPQGGSQSKGVGESIKFYANATNSTGGTLDSATCIIYFNDSQSGMTYNSGIYEYSRTFSEEGIYDWNVTCESSGYENSTKTDTVTVSQDMYVILNTPINQNDSVDFDVLNTFNCSATGTNLKNITLYHDIHGSWLPQETLSISGSEDSASFEVDISSIIGNDTFLDSRFRWNCLAYNSNSESVWADSNFTFSGWDLGVYENITLNNTNGSIKLADKGNGEYYDSGEYYSRIFGSENTTSELINITWDPVLEGFEGDTNITVYVRVCDDENCENDDFEVTCTEDKYCNLTTLSREKYFQYKVSFSTLDIAYYTPRLLLDSVKGGRVVRGRPHRVDELLLPENNSTIFNRTPEFFWENVTEPLDEPVTYELQVSNSSDFSYLIFNITGIEEGTPTNTSWESNKTLELGETYWWQVRAYDGKIYGQWTKDPWNFTVESSVILSLLVNSVEFGNFDITNKDRENTSDNSPRPILIENQGNTEVDITINATHMWDSVQNPSQYFRYMIGINESNSFDEGSSTTSWTDMPYTNNVVDIKKLNWSDDNDTAEIDLLVIAPPQESPGVKKSILTLYAEASS